MSILIKGMEMPKRGESCLVITITPDGEIYKNVYDASFRVNQVGEAVPVQPHGRLIDADALWAEINKICDRRDAGIIADLTCLQQILSAVRHAPTIIPAEEVKES